ncbi:hypothetical protein HYS84_03720 [Candidatus Saccharibacteria bacterium]|nr:hypothetical protein [Candidatus Saccharibacteria bacterium]
MITDVERREDGKFVLTVNVTGQIKAVQKGDIFKFEGRKYQVESAESIYDGTLKFIAVAFAVGK